MQYYWNKLSANYMIKIATSHCRHDNGLNVHVQSDSDVNLCMWNLQIKLLHLWHTQVLGKAFFSPVEIHFDNLSKDVCNDYCQLCRWGTSYTSYTSSLLPLYKAPSKSLFCSESPMFVKLSTALLDFLRKSLPPAAINHNMRCKEQLPKPGNKTNNRVR